ncbi:MAG TPA: hypothetical protein VNT92_06700 [Acidimicrobiia bacterium]|nr:hypothetical protein [Acidimicrobiia bacterium]
MTVSALARQSGVPRSALRGWLAGANMPILGLSWLARALAVDFAKLTEGT